MKIGKKIAVIGIISVIFAAIAAITSMADNLNIYYDFEDEFCGWTALYDNADFEFEKEENGNTYLKLSYNGRENKNRKYFDVKAANISSKKNIVQADYDVMYTETDTDRNGEIHFKERTGPGSSQTSLVARLAKTQEFFQIQPGGSFERIKGIGGDYLTIETGRWYSVKLIVDLQNKKQTVYIFDRDTQKMLAYYEQLDTIDGNGEINMITFSSSTTMCLDNVHIYETSFNKARIYGEPYVTSATKNKYYILGEDSGKNITALPDGTTTWTLETPHSGVSVDSDTGRIIVGSKPEPGTVILRADRETSNGILSAKFIVNVSM